MKTAVLISGQPRNVEENFENIKNNILIPNDYPDIFVHCWISNDIIGKRFYSPWITLDKVNDYHREQFKDLVNEKNCIPTSEPVPPDIREKILNLYNPKKFVFEKQKQFTFDEKFYSILKNIGVEELNKRVPDTLSMYYSTYYANLLKQSYEIQNNFVYDYVLKIRFDLLLGKPLIVKEYDPTKITASNHHWPHDICFTNVWALGSSKIMNIYAETYLHVFDIMQSPTTMFTDECILGQHIYNNGIEKNLISFPTNYLRLKNVVM